MPSSTTSISAHVLLVEDDPVNQIVIKGLLNLIGCEVTLAGAGKEALALLTSPNASFDIVLMDIGLPDINGMEVTRQLRKSESKLSHIPVIALTGHVSPQDQQACINSGMNRFISKPTTKDVLQKELAGLLHTA
jgi:CheY-like chemotaxis protein